MSIIECPLKVNHDLAKVVLMCSKHILTIHFLLKFVKYFILLVFEHQFELVDFGLPPEAVVYYC